MRSVATFLIAGVGVFGARPLVAQRDSSRAYRETGIELSAVGSKPSGRAAEFTTPISLRFGCFSPATLWGGELRVGLSDHRSAAFGRTVSLATGFSVLRRFGPREGPRTIMGRYLTAGFTMTKFAPGFHAPPALAFGVNAGVGRRFALGHSGTLRPEILMSHDFAARVGELGYPRATRLAFRIGVSTWGM